MTLPFLRLEGSPYEQGVQHGQALADAIHANLALYLHRFEHEAGLRPAEALHRASLYERPIAHASPAYAADMQGVADGAGLGLAEVLLLNVRYELLYYQFGQQALLGVAGGAGTRVGEGCSAFAVHPSASANGHLLVGQNWDWIPEVRGVVLETQDDDGLRTLAFSEAGIVGGKIGLNSAGVALAINGLTSLDDDWGRLTAPFHVRCYQVLRSRTFEDALDVIHDTPRACAANFVLAQRPDRVLNVEAAPHRHLERGFEAGLVVHTNHFRDPAAAGVEEPPIEHRPHSEHRLRRLTTLLDAARPVTQDALEAALRDHEDHPYGICRHPDEAEPPHERYATVVSVIMDPAEGTLAITDGPPCENTYKMYRLEVSSVRPRPPGGRLEHQQPTR